MTNTQIFIRFAGVTVATLVALAIAAGLLASFAGIDLGSGLGIVSIIVPAMDAGQNYARKTGSALSKGQMWRIAFGGFLINVLVSLPLVAIIASITGLDLTPIFEVLGIGALVGIGMVFAIFYILIARFFIGLGQRQALKAAR